MATCLPCFLGDLLESVLGDREHPAGSAGAVVKKVGAGLDLVCYGKEDEVGHQLDGIPGCPVLAGLFIVVLVEAADQILKHGAHGVVVEAGQVADGARAEVDILVEELFDERAKGIGLRQAWDLVPELEVLQNVLHVRREPVEVDLEVVPQLLLGSPGLEITEAERGGIVEGLTRCRTEERRVLIRNAFLIEGGLHLHDRVFGRLQHGIQASDHGHGKNDVTVLASDVNITQCVVGDTPDEVRQPVELGLVHELKLRWDEECQGAVWAVILGSLGNQSSTA